VILGDARKAGVPAGAGALTPIDLYLILAGDARRPLRVEDFRPRFEALELPLGMRHKELLYAHVEMARELELEEMHRKRTYHIRLLNDQRAAGQAGGAASPAATTPHHTRTVAVGSGGWMTRLLSGMREGGSTERAASWRAFHEDHPHVSARQFEDGWAALELELSRAAEQRGGVSATHVVRSLVLALCALCVLLALVALGTRGLTGLGTDDALQAPADDASFVAVVEALLTLGCGLLVAACRQPARAEVDADGVAAELVDAEMARAAED